MAITKPYTFQAGTKARAGEVNQDFDILYSEVNRIGTEILNIDVDIQDILSSKADVNGNATQRFQMANPEANYDGVNKIYLENAIANIKDYISGLIITKDTDNTIIVSPGSCYDSNFTTIMISTGNITKENTTQSPDTIYYVHVISDNTGRQVDVLISPQSIEPPLPYGYALYRQIGKFSTDSNGNINSILYYGNLQPSYNQTTGVIETYSNDSSWYRVYSDGWCEQGGKVASQGENRARVYELLKPFKDTNYSVLITENSNASGCYQAKAYSTSESTFTLRTSSGGGQGGYNWRAYGYIA